jgi:hypothetical protein
MLFPPSPQLPSPHLLHVSPTAKSATPSSPTQPQHPTEIATSLVAPTSPLTSSIAAPPIPCIDPPHPHLIIPTAFNIVPPTPPLNSSPEPIVPHVHPMTTRSRTGSLQPKTFADYKLYHATRHPPTPLLTVLSEAEPSCFSKAVNDSRWREAMTHEFNALISNGTWTLCPRPLNRHVIRNRWVYKIKQRADGSIDRFKARLVAKGFEQQNGVDYT